MKLKQRKIELELKLKQKELETKQNQKQDQNIDQENTIFKQSQPQDSKKMERSIEKMQTDQYSQPSSTLAQMKEAERVKKEKRKILYQVNLNNWQYLQELIMFKLKRSYQKEK